MVVKYECDLCGDACEGHMPRIRFWYHNREIEMSDIVLFTNRFSHETFIGKTDMPVPKPIQNICRACLEGMFKEGNIIHR